MIFGGRKLQVTVFRSLLIQNVVSGIDTRKTGCMHANNNDSYYLTFRFL